MDNVPAYSRAEQGTATYGMNQFADLTEEEFSKHYLSPVTSKDMNMLNSLAEAEEVDVADTPAEMDWRTKSKANYWIFAMKISSRYVAP